MDNLGTRIKKSKLAKILAEMYPEKFLTTRQNLLSKSPEEEAIFVGNLKGARGMAANQTDSHMISFQNIIATFDCVLETIFWIKSQGGGGG